MPAAVLVAYCRGGFEDEAAADLRRIAAHAHVALDIVVERGSALVVAHGDAIEPRTWERAILAAPPIFARCAFQGTGPVDLLPGEAATGRADRVTPLLAAIADVAAVAAPPWRSVWIEYPDTNEGKALSTLARALAPRIEGALRAAGQLADHARRRLHAVLRDGTAAFVGTSVASTRDWPLGIARLRMPGGAPSRSTLKLAEALQTFLGEQEATLLRPGLRAVDLGAAPGGWTWQLAQRGLRVTAIDNGPLKGAVARDPLVTHLREDGLRWRPRRPVDWLVCDIVEQPIRIAELVAHWLAEGFARSAIFNLKLPMKKRYDEVRRCEQRIGEILDRAGVRHSLRIRQLYHDREEVTAYLARVD